MAGLDGVNSGRYKRSDVPLVPLPDVILLTQVHEIRDRLRSEEHQTVDHFNLNKGI